MTKFHTQELRAFIAFFRHPKTMLMVSIETGILRADLCRYVARWRQQGRITIVKQGLCRISKHRAGYYSTNPDIVSKEVCDG